ncbi:hypothetical protein E1A91_A10G127100v1 [Gossypium mustelinum]|uniref:Uncharacterized protein n=1 Tax=Gossypium mustelinum TaxID=34275 RepID=A0A5D2XKX6_GOSMU|nr:hypothetical protein E1A91_A10G127100v1 [Gossypium mustelinum]
MHAQPPPGLSQSNTSFSQTGPTLRLSMCCCIRQTSYIAKANHLPQLSIEIPARGQRPPSSRMPAPPL